MPELPEVETVARDLGSVATGLAIDRVVVTGRRTVRRQSAAELIERLERRTVVSAGRLGKHVVVSLDDGQRLIVHLRMSGQLRWHQPADPVAAHTHVVVTMSSGEELRFVDPRTFGEWFVGTPDELSRIAPTLSNSGLDLFAAPPSPAVFAAALQRRIAIKALLQRPDVIAGIGNIYSDEICHRARVRHDRVAADLGRPAVDRLRTEAIAVLAEAVADRGSSLRDRQYVDLWGQIGSYQARHQVYDREGQPCHRCGRPIVRLAFQQRSTFCCPRCQR